ncbi:MAG TPA: hypothetical protein VIA62_02540 [Thermoanaerobaculia bacterium]|nr:hypothetical protein [Thermoanaerobaculia bacterium]
MNRMRIALILLLSSAWLVVAGPRGLAAQPAPLGPEVLLPSEKLPQNPVLAVQPGGDYVVAWDEDGGDLLDPPGEVFSRFIAAGSKPPNEQPVPLESPGHYPQVYDVTATPKGFDVLWFLVGDSGSLAGFYRHHLNLQGEPDGAPIPLGGPGTDWVWNVRGNGFMAVWALPRARGIAARRLTSSGQRTGPELRLNSRPVDSPAVWVLGVANGGFLAVWLGSVPGSVFPDTVLRARRFSPAGKPLGPDFDVNTVLPGPEGVTTWPYLGPDFVVAAAPGGGFAVAWTFGFSIHLRLFDAAGRAAGPEVQAVTSPTVWATPKPQSMAFDKAGKLLLMWVEGPEDETDLQIQLFDPHGAPLGPPEGVSSAASGRYQEPWEGSVAWAGDSWLVTWVAATISPPSSAVFVRRFAAK